MYYNNGLLYNRYYLFFIKKIKLWFKKINAKHSNSFKTAIAPYLAASLTLLSSLSLTSCIIVGPNFRSPPPPCAETYTEDPLPAKTASTPIKAGNAQHFAFCKELPGDWWNLFHYPELKEVIAQGVANSPNIEAAKMALTQAQELMEAYRGSAYLPTVDGQFFAGKQRFSGSTIGEIDQDAVTFNLYSGVINITYNLDIFGGSARQLEAYYAEVENKCFLVEAAYLTLTSSIVNTAIAEASLREQILATEDIISINENLLNIIKKQLNLGGASLVDVLAQQTQLEQVKATLPPLQKNLAIVRHSLAALVGCFPSEACLPKFHLHKFKLPKVLPVSLPSCLVRQRPDIRASEALLHKASAEVGVATANLFPQFSLTGTYGTTANTPADLFKNLSNVWSYFGQVTQPIFHGGALRATRRASIAAFNQAAAQYKQTVLQGFQNVADSLKAIEKDALTLRELSIAEKTARDSFDLVQRQFRLGAVNYLSLLNAEQQYQKIRLNRIQGQASRFSDTVALFQALGGGWWNCDE